MVGKRLILFDIDGTLLRTKGAGRESTKQAMIEVFGTAAAIDKHQFGGKTDWYTLVELLAEHGYDEHRIGEHMPRYEEVVARHLKRLFENGLSAQALPGAMQAVQQLRQAVDDTVIGLLTGNCASTAPIKLRAAGYDPAWFPVGAFGSEAVHRNDLPAIALERARQYTGWPITPAQVYVIGDTPADVQCARALGAIAVAVTTGFSPREALTAAQPDHLLDDMMDLFEVL